MYVHFVCVGSSSSSLSSESMSVVFGTHGIIILMELSSKGIIRDSESCDEDHNFSARDEISHGMSSNTIYAPLKNFSLLESNKELK